MPVRNDLFRLVERIGGELVSRGSVALDDLDHLARTADEAKLLNRAIRFMIDRDEALLDLQEGTLLSRRHVTTGILAALRASGRPLTIDDLARSGGCGTAACCDAIGWLEREGRVRLTPGDQVSLVGGG